MGPLPIASLSLLAALAAYASASDIRKGVVSNRVLAPSAAIAAALAVAHYGFSSPELALAFLANAAIVAALSVILFCTRTWAGGDCKLMCVIALLYPAELYVEWFGGTLTLFAAIALALVLGWLFAVGRSAVLALRGARSFSAGEFGRSFLRFLVGYLRMLAYITALNGILLLAFPGIATSGIPLVPALCFCLAWLTNSVGFLKSRWLLAAAIAAVIAESVLLGRPPLASSPMLYALVLATAALRSFSTQGSYRTIPTSQVEKGMILSAATTAMFARSRVKGLPDISTEDLGSRITEEEAASVRRWETSARGLPEITIVEKTPFAPFVCAGTLAYMLIWSLT